MPSPIATLCQVLTKSDEIKDTRYLLAWIKGEDVEDDDDGTVSTAAELGQVSLAKGWTATMLEMPKRTVTAEGGRKVNYYTAHAAERLKKQEEAEKRFFGGPDAKDVMHELWDQGLAGTGALAAKLTREYFEYSRGDWLRQTLMRLLEYELQLRSELALLGTTDGEQKDQLAEAEVASTLEDGAKALTARFVSEHLLCDGGLFPWLSAVVEEEKTVRADEIDSALHALQDDLRQRVAVAVGAVSTFYADELQKMLDAPVRVMPAEEEDGVPAGGPVELSRGQPAPGALSARFWVHAGRLVRSFFGTSESLPPRAFEVHKRIVSQPIIQLGAYPDFTRAIADVVRTECAERHRKLERATTAIIDQVSADASMYIHVVPGDALETAELCFRSERKPGVYDQPGVYIVDALKAAFMRYLPAPQQLQAAVAERASRDLKLSRFEESAQAATKRLEIEERLTRVRGATRALVRALDVDESSPLDSAWLAKLQVENGLPADDLVLFTQTEVATALASFETFHRLARGAATVRQLQRSSAQLAGWLAASLSIQASMGAEASTTIQKIARRRSAIEAFKAIKAAAAEDMSVKPSVNLFD